MNIQQLSTREKILLTEQLWDSVRADAISSPLTEAQKSELDARLASYELNPEDGNSWENVKIRILK